ncbi:hypothetical protein BBO_05304 [Beauveria brongniartii RCEF 3172]|uniref:Uncharacterized protein n=1 Tax=Beauveria brongniartii RCEF 3172 TaxID=1081107 RepID=A0A167D4X0_9HYPO|nr:hypothetical protein BBO_05304 [Beauveria brongniartii RCEF 3172]
MSRYFPHTAYAEDQPLARTILATHVATRAVTLGTLLGITMTGARTIIPALRPWVEHQQQQQPPFAARLLRSCSGSILATLGVAGVGLVVRMWGRDDIEWRDRSWRLMESKGQLETDDWTYGGIAAAATTAALVMVKGAAGLGSVGGMMGYLGWRYGVNGGRFPEKLPRKEERIGM